MPNPWGQTTFADRDRANRQKQLQYADDLYQARIRTENIKNVELQNAALSSSILAMGGSVPGQSSPNLSVRARSPGPTWAEQIAAFPTARPTVQAAPAPSRVDTSGASAIASAGGGGSEDFPSLAEIRGMIESSQQKAEEDFDGKINLLQNQERQKQEEEQTSARNAASRTLSYQQRAAAGAWESALRGR